VPELVWSQDPAARRSEATPAERNAAAWLLLTHEFEECRDPQAALPLARRATEASGGNDPAILDTLALALFETGDVAAAVETESKTVALLAPGDSALRAELEASLARFEAVLEEDQ
jgi:hypothetical protein